MSEQRGRVLILVDVQNVYYTTRQALGCNLDYNRLWSRVTQNRQLVKAFAYAIDRGDKKQREFQNILRAIGFEVKLKPFIQRADGSAKGDWDVGITIDALEYADAADTIVLLSGDGDFALLAEKLGQKGKRVEVYAVPELTSLALINAASEFFPIEGELLLGQ
ncbi:nuclease [Shewanella carassii]|uniref:LabA-like NYN domain-containing protein n=1 Tax=Shewanella carassii TaxID=1987584 RepID=UPI001BF0FC88|nr:NYN domain-containing protein [Shewanella carassii]BCV66710.1 nuclease [Shewanella carassii]